MDGLPCDFYKAMWDTIGDDLCSLASRDFLTSRSSDFLNQGLIKFILNNAYKDSIVR
jgi:hypothetical protein